MSEMKSYKELLKQIESYIQKLENASLTMDELFELEKLTAKLHERSIILKYKAFENKVGVSAAQSTGSITQEEKPVIQQEPTEKIQEEESADLEFSLFQEEENEPEPFVFEAPDETEDIPVSTLESTKPEVTEKEEKIESVEPVHQKETENSESSFLDRFQATDDSISSQFAGSKLNTLVGAFGLNEKLRFINDLFDGSSETFSDAVKALDSKSSLSEASQLVEKLANEHSWDPEEEVVSEFMVYVKRRYA